jgi:hypothetical protein
MGVIIFKIFIKGDRYWMKNIVEEYIIEIN